jgi:myxalamid-type nonribosomal peptide synthetase MxaA
MSGVACVPLRVQPDVFSDCIEQVVARHEILRTRFMMADGEPAGIVADQVAIGVRVLGELPAAEREELFRQDAMRPFDLREAPLLRVTIAPDGDGSTFVQLTMHHIVSDGFSTSVFFRELGELYQLRLAGKTTGLPALPFQFADVAAWERQHCDSPAQAESLRYWSSHLRGAPERLALPADHPRPARMAHHGKRLQVELPADLAEQVRLLSQQLGVTPFVTLLAAFVVTLSRCAAADDLIIGIPVANREQRGVEQLTGPFLNTLALRFDLRAAPAFAELSQQVSRTFLAGLEHQEVPFERVLRKVQDNRDPSRSPLFQVVFNFQADQSTAGTPGSQLQDLPNGGCDFDLLLDIVGAATGLTAHIDYYADVYDQPTVARLADAFRAVLRAAASSAELPVTELSLIPADAYPGIAAAAAGPVMPQDRDCGVPELILRQAER